MERTKVYDISYADYMLNFIVKQQASKMRMIIHT